MINEITIESFKAISSPTTIPLRDFNVVIGRNSSGKSSIIESLEWLSDCITLGASMATKQFRRIDDIVYSGSDSFDISLSFNPNDLSVGSKVVYSISVAKSDGLPKILKEYLAYQNGSQISDRIKTIENNREYSLSLKGEISKEDRNLIRKRAKGDNQAKPLESILYLLDTLEAQQFSVSNNPDETVLKIIDPKVDRGGMLLKDFLERSVFLSLNPKSIGDFSDVLADSVGKKLLDKQGWQVARLLSELDEESLSILIEKIAFITGRTTGCEVHQPQGPADRRFFEFIEKIEDSTNKIPGWVLSEGTRRVTAILALLLHETPPPLICIEEIENGLDPWTIKFLLEELAAASLSGVQIIVTTHSPYLLNHISIDNVIFVNRQQNGVVKVMSGQNTSLLSEVCEHMGVGDIYTSRYLHEASEGR